MARNAQCNLPCKFLSKTGSHEPIKYIFHSQLSIEFWYQNTKVFLFSVLFFVFYITEVDVSICRLTMGSVSLMTSLETDDVTGCVSGGILKTKPRGSSLWSRSSDDWKSRSLLQFKALTRPTSWNKSILESFCKSKPGFRLHSWTDNGDLILARYFERNIKIPMQFGNGRYADNPR